MSGPFMLVLKFENHFKPMFFHLISAAADSDASPLTRFQTDEPDFGRHKINVINNKHLNAESILQTVITTTKQRFV